AGDRVGFDTTYPGIPNASWWAQDVKNGKRVRGLLWPYLGDTQDVGECPINKRQTTTGSTQENVWFTQTGVEFDYTFFDEVEGTRLGCRSAVAYLPPGKDTSGFNLKSTGAFLLTRFRDIPVFVEESTKWNNESSRDGMWGNNDQITLRHGGNKKGVN